MTGVSVTREEMSVWSRYIGEICGIQLDDSKAYLLHTRLGDVMRSVGVGSLSELYFRAKSDPSHAIRRKVIDAITTNETSFFRDQAPFELLRHKLLPELIDRRRRPGSRSVSLRIWSAACSTGQEAYSVGVVLWDLLGDLRAHDIRIVGTDISDQAVARASYAHYSRLELERGMAADKVARYFVPVREKWKVRDEIRAIASFRTLNLLQPFTFPSSFDIVFCRNVAIYFSEADRKRLFQAVGRYLARDGALILGATESMLGLCPEFESKRHLRTVYYEWRKPFAAVTAGEVVMNTKRETGGLAGR